MPEAWLYVPHGNSRILCFVLNYGGPKNAVVQVLQYIYFDVRCVETTSNFTVFHWFLCSGVWVLIGQQLISNS